jgi:CHAT domain-containing protein
LVIFWLNTAVFSQTEPPELVLNKPINTEFNGKSTKDFNEQLSERRALETSLFFQVSLLAGQTGRIEVEYDGLGIELFARKPSGERYIFLDSPSGRKGSKTLLATADKDGLYGVEIRPVHTIPRPIRIKIELKEIRRTTENDHLINKTYTQIYQLARELKNNLSLRSTERQKFIEKQLEVIRLARIVGDKFWEGEALMVTGSIYLSLGEIQSALETWLKAREVYREIKDRYKEGIAVGNLGVLSLNVGDYERAINYFKEGQLIQAETINRFDKAAAFSNLGMAYFALDRFDKAILYTKQAFDLYSQMKIASGQARQAGILGRFYSTLADYSKATEYLNESIVLAEKSGNRQQISNSKLQLGIIYSKLGKKEEAFALFEEASSVAKELGNKRLEVSCLYHLAQAQHEQGNLKEAIKNLENGIGVIEKIRGNLRSKSQRTSYFSTVQNFYELYTELLVERSEKDKDPAGVARAFEISELSRSRSLIDLLQEARVDFKQSVDTKLLEREKYLTNLLNIKYQNRESLVRQKAKKEQIDKINFEINDLDLELENLNLQIQNESPKYAKLSRGKTLSTEEIQQLLDDETILLEYKLGKKRSFLWLLNENSIKLYPLPGRNEIEKKVQEFYDLVTRNERTEIVRQQELAEHLNRILLSPVENKIKGKRLAIVADGILQYLPFSALWSSESGVQSPGSGSGQSLIETNEIVMLPSASVLAQIRENKNKVNTNKIAIFADPVFDKNDSRFASKSEPVTLTVEMQKATRDFRFGETLPRLLSSRREARSISSLFSKDMASVRLGFEASVENIENSNLKDFKILHFATHGLLNTNRPELSGLVFSLYDQKGNLQDGFLSLNDIYNLELESDMIVLSACQTALGKDVRGEGLIGVSRGFLYAGSKRIIASLWKVDDAATAEFMKRFYRNYLQEEMPASKALQQTKIEMKNIKRYSSPYYWSAFTLLGDWK